jgi:hypothetical protein
LVNFLQLLMSTLLGSWLRRDCPAEVFHPFGRVLLQDSTTPEAPPLSGQIFSRLR